jgi:ATP-dependent DNA helicase DinG
MIKNPTPSELGLPFKSFRKNQLETSEKILESDKKFVILQAPWGTGKTAIAATVQRLLREQVLYCCSTKLLQQQVLDDFAFLNTGEPFAVTLKGRSNYPTLLFPDQYPDISAENCTSSREDHCRYCCSGVKDSGAANCFVRFSCEYQKAKKTAEKALLPVLNTAMFLNLSEHTQLFKANKLLVLDEADILDDELMKFVEVTMRQSWAKRLGISQPKYKTKEEAWIKWAEDALPIAESRLGELKEAYGVENLREETILERLIYKLKHFLDAIKEDSWVFLPDTYTFKPVFVSQYGDMFWSKADKVLLMSATIISPNQLCKDLGINKQDTEFIDLPATFPVERRRIFYKPLADMTAKLKDQQWPLMIRGLDEIFEQHKTRNILVHTQSQQLASAIKQRSKRPDTMMTYKNVSAGAFRTGSRVSEKDWALSQFKNSETPMVLLAQSMDRGVNLPDDECRVNIIAKIPYPYLGDKQISKRVYGSRDGSAWYAVKTIRNLIQETGRGNRHEKDWCLIFIVDKQFEVLMRKWSKLPPSWWRDALVMPKAEKKPGLKSRSRLGQKANPES